MATGFSLVEDNRWQVVKDFFDRALEIPEAKRLEFVQTAITDSEIRREVLRLLEGWEMAETWFDQAAKSVWTITSAPALTNGDLLSGRYRINRFIAHGGMGEVYEAEDCLLSGVVALKILRPTIAFQPGIHTRFRKEIQLSRSIKSPHVCKVHDIGTHREEDGSEFSFYTMELLDGETLATFLKGRKPLTLTEARPLIRGMALGLEAAHQAGILHLDFKPGNVILSAGGPVITDFGLAQELVSTHDTGRAATPAYAAPEQIAGEKQTVSADVYSFGVVIHEMLTGHLPSSGRSSSVPGIVQQCLARDPNERPSSAGDVARKLGALESQSLLSRRALWLIPVSVIGAVGGYEFARPRKPLLGHGARIVVSDPENPALTIRDSNTLPALLREQLRQSGSVIPVSALEIRNSRDRIGKSVPAVLTVEDWRQIALRCGASVLVHMQFSSRLGGNGEVVRFTMESLGNSRYSPLDSRSQTFTLAGSTQLPSIVQDVAVWIRENVGESRDRILASSLPVTEITTHSWEALRDYVASESASDPALQLAYLHSATRHDEQFALAWTRLGDLYYASAQDDKGQACYRKAINCIGNRLAPREEFRIRSIYANDQWDYQEADRQFRMWNDQFPADSDAGLYRVSSLLALNRGDEALTLYSNLTRKQPGNATAFQHLALSCLFTGKYEQLEFALAKLTTLGRTDLAEHWRAAKWFLQGRYDAAATLFRDQLSDLNSKRRFFSAYWLLWTQAWKGDFEAALQDASTVSKEQVPPGKEGQAADFYLGLASLLSVSHGEASAILNLIEKALTLSGGPNHAFRAGVILARMGRLRQCRLLLDTHFGNPQTVKERLWSTRLRAHLALAAKDSWNAIQLFEQARAIKTNKIETEWGLTLAYKQLGDAPMTQQAQVEFRNSAAVYWWWLAPELIGMKQVLT